MRDVFRAMLSFLQGKFLEKQLCDNDELAKYVFKKKDLRADGSIRPAILKPRQGEMLSLFEVTDMDHEHICRHGHDFVDNPEKKRVHIGYGKFQNISFIQLELKTILDNNPPKHVSVEFPDEPERRRELAKALAGKLISSECEGNKNYFSSCS